MKAVLQRVSSASVLVKGRVIGSIAHGWLVLLGIYHQDSEKECQYLADKVAGLRAFNDELEKMNLNIKQVSGSILVVSQFTLYGDCHKGRRPNFQAAAKPEKALELYLRFVKELRNLEIEVATGEFGANMQVNMQGDGPVTLILSS
ncbi:MAG: D-aminoacyl-tRNA deacylase [Oligoflexales bacterium]